MALAQLGTIRKRCKTCLLPQEGGQEVEGVSGVLVFQKAA